MNQKISLRIKKRLGGYVEAVAHAGCWTKKVRYL